MTAILYLLGALALLAGVAGVVLPMLPGAPLLVLGAVLVGWAEGFTRLGWPTIVAVALLAVAIWGTDLAAAALGAKAFGASRWAVVGASIGLVIGIFLGLPGIVLGPAVGAVVLEYAKNPDLVRALQAGGGTFLGFLLGHVVKAVLALAVVGLVVLALVL